MSAIVNQKKLAEDLGISLSTVRSRVKEMRDQQGKYFKTQVVFDDGNLVLVNKLAFMDWMGKRALINKHVRVDPFDPMAMAESMGIIERPPVADNSKELAEIKEMLFQVGSTFTRYAETH